MARGSERLKKIFERAAAVAPLLGGSVSLIIRKSHPDSWIQIFVIGCLVGLDLFIIGQICDPDLGGCEGGIG